MTEQDLAAFDRESERRQRAADFDAAHPEYRECGEAVQRPDGATERDAARYRWLREQVRLKRTMTLAQALFWNHSSRRQFDEAVDYAMTRTNDSDPKQQQGAE